MTSSAGWHNQLRNQLAVWFIRTDITTYKYLNADRGKPALRHICEPLRLTNKKVHKWITLIEPVWPKRALVDRQLYCMIVLHNMRWYRQLTQGTNVHIF